MTSRTALKNSHLESRTKISQLDIIFAPETLLKTPILRSEYRSKENDENSSAFSAAFEEILLLKHKLRAVS